MEDDTSLESAPVSGAGGGESRRSFLSEAAMAGGLAASYGTFAAMAGGFLYPAKPRETVWLLVTPIAEFPASGALNYRLPSGEAVTVTRAGEDGGFLALSGTCPHLGCKVHWEGANKRFFCPCHNGVFSPVGEPLSGPPADAGQPLLRYPLEKRGGMLFIEAPVDVADASGTGEPPCGRPSAGDANPPGETEGARLA